MSESPQERAATFEQEVFIAAHPDWEHLKFEYGRWTTTHRNYDASWEGEEDGWVDNGLMAEGRTLADLEDDIACIEEEKGLRK
jgi:hypothetical protein